MQPVQLLQELDKVFANSNVSEHPYFQSWWNDLKVLVTDEFPEYTRLMMGSVYRFTGKKGAQCRGVVTKENEKTWVLYETSDSSRPGCRWMLSKTWCTKDNVYRDETQSYTLPEGLRVK